MQMETNWFVDIKIKNKLIVAILICFPLCFWLIPFKVIENNSLCIFYNLFHKQCPGCGTTRAVHSIIHFKFYKAYEYNKLIVITFPILAFEYLKFIIVYYKKGFNKI